MPNNIHYIHYALNSSDMTYLYSNECTSFHFTTTHTGQKVYHEEQVIDKLKKYTHGWNWYTNDGGSMFSQAVSESTSDSSLFSLIKGLVKITSPDPDLNTNDETITLGLRGT